MNHLLEINNLSVAFGSKKNHTNVIENLSFFVDKGETLGIVGESGSGKSVTSLAVMGLLSPETSSVSGDILFDKKNLLALSNKELQQIRGNKIAMIFQEPMTSLNPIISCGKQIMEPLLLHTNISKKAAQDKVIELLGLCGIPEPQQRFHEYPHQMSGGMRQRIMIAIALACHPELLIADEPTTALDVTIQAQILELMKELKSKIKMSMMMITHDLGIVVDSCDRVIIMYTGQIVESGTVKEIFHSPKHPYTIGLLQAIPKLDTPKGQLSTIEGMVPDSDKMPDGCRFHPRCPFAKEKCHLQTPALKFLNSTRSVRCFLHDKEEEMI